MVIVDITASGKSVRKKSPQMGEADCKLNSILGALPQQLLDDVGRYVK